MHARTTLPALSLVAALALAGCGATADADAAPSASTTAAATAAAGVTVEDPWVKSAGSGMSAAFGRVVNAGTQDVTVVSATTPASTVLELHETVDDGTGAMTMREKEGGFTIAAGDTLDLTPGGDHLMLMDLVAPVVAGDEVVFTLTFSDGSTVEFTAPGKDYAGANETYAGGDAHTDPGVNEDMDMGHGADAEMDHGADASGH